MTDPRDLLDADTLRARGGLKWTRMSADIAAWVAEADFGTAPAVTAALHDAVDAGMLGYLPPAVRRAMAEACASWLADTYGWDVPPSRVLPVGHVTEALQITIARYTAPGTPVILPTPAYMPFVTAPAVWGREVRQVPMASDGGRPVLDLDALDAALGAGGGLLVLVNPHNPTGRVLDRAELEAVAGVVARNGGRVFSDEIHAPLVYPGGRHVPYASVSPEAAAHTVTATSASKAWNIPGVKCAQLILSNDADAEAWMPDDDLLAEGASTLGALAAAAAYTDGRAWLADQLAYLDGNRMALADALAGSGIGYQPPEGTYLAWLDLRAVLDAHADDDALPRWRTAPAGALGGWLRRRTGVAITDGALCGDAGRGFVRMNVATGRPLVVEAARRIADRLS